VLNEFVAYFDDSGHPDNQMAVVVAGFLAAKDQWIAFDSEWSDTLFEFGVSYFHMADFEREVGEFKGWKPKKRSKFLNRLLGIINRNTAYPVSDAVLMTDYKKINEVYPFQEYFGAPYALVGRSICAKLNRWRNENASLDPRLSIFFENGTKHKGDLEEVMRHDNLPSPIFLEKSVNAMQAADLFSWEVFTAIRTGGALRTGIVRDSFCTLVPRGPRRKFHGVYTYPNLERLCKSQEVPLRAALHPDTTISYRHSKKRIRKRTIF
jgi:hypothetical protein